EQRDDEAERREADDETGKVRPPDMVREELVALLETEHRAEHDDDRDRAADAETAPQALGQVALEHRLLGTARIVEHGDAAADRISGELPRNLEIAEVLADRDAVVAQRPAADHIFVDDIGEVALLEPVAVLALAVH